MIAIKFDKEKVENCINAYKEEHGKLPYLIMSSKTKELLPQNYGYINTGDLSFTISTTTIEKPKDIIIGGMKYIPEEELKKGFGAWYGCKIMIDDDLDYGEILI